MVSIQQDSDDTQTQYLIKDLKETERNNGLGTLAEQARSSYSCDSKRLTDCLVANQTARKHALETATMARVWAMRETTCRRCPCHPDTPQEHCAECRRVCRELDTIASFREALG